jgi:hypothetical protein
MKLLYMAAMVLLAVPLIAQEPKPGAAPSGVLSAAEVERLMPGSVFFQGQSATVQTRNSFGVRFGGGRIMLAGLVDTGGYSSAIRDKYQFYLLSDTSIEISGKRLPPGAYGCGFVQDELVVMDLGGNEVWRRPVAHDAAMARPRPLQIVAAGMAGEFRLYLGRDFVTFRH